MYLDFGFCILCTHTPPRSPQEQPKGKQNEPFRAFNRMKKMAPWVGSLLAYIIREQKTTIRPAIRKSF